MKVWQVWVPEPEIKRALVAAARGSGWALSPRVELGDDCDKVLSAPRDENDRVHAYHRLMSDCETVSLHEAFRRLLAGPPQRPKPKHIATVGIEKYKVMLHPDGSLEVGSVTVGKDVSSQIARAVLDTIT